MGSGGSLTVILRNMQGANINITNVTATYQGMDRYNNTYVVVNPNEQTTFNITGFNGQTSGAPYSVDVEISYTNVDTGLTFKSTGTVSGTVS